LWVAPVAALVACVAAPVAAADSVVSADWAGYAIHGNLDHFRQVRGFWRQPKLVCTPGQTTYAEIWAGLGGFAPRSIAVEQLGTEGDCHANGREVSYAWYSLRSGVRKPISMLIKPGDVMEAVVTLGRGTVTLELADHSTPQLFAQTLPDTKLDDSSADWIVEARPFCIGPSACQPLPLANFRYVSFGLTGATLSNGHTGTISDPKWTATKVSIGLHGRRYGLNHAANSAVVGGAAPSALAAGGSVFTVSYRTLSVGASPFL
jgi:hypothetical protein